MTSALTPEPNSRDPREYGFTDKVPAYVANRPAWNEQFARYSLERAGCIEENGVFRTMDDRVPVVASMGSGPGVDAAEFKRLGCDVRLVEPNRDFLDYSQIALSEIPGGNAEFHNAPAIRSNLTAQSIDLIVCAQSIHSMKHDYSYEYIPTAQRNAGVNAEEWTRKHWAKLLRGDGERIFVWYYNPDPGAAVTRELHDILIELLPAYANSGTQFFLAEYFKPQHFQPWIAAEAMNISPRMPVDELHLELDMIAGWLESYSFAPPGPETTALAERLKEEWFAEFNDNGSLKLNYVGFVASGPLRKDAFDTRKIAEPLELEDPLSP